LYKLMKAQNLHEGCIEQMHRLFEQHLYNSNRVGVDSENRIRLDDWEMRADIQKGVLDLWDQVDTQSIEKLTDLAGVRLDFYKLFGFNLPGVDYNQEVDPNVKIASVEESKADV